MLHFWIFLKISITTFNSRCLNVMERDMDVEKILGSFIIHKTLCFDVSLIVNVFLKYRVTWRSDGFLIDVMKPFIFWKWNKRFLPDTHVIACAKIAWTEKNYYILIKHSKTQETSLRKKKTFEHIKTNNNSLRKNAIKIF